MQLLPVEKEVNYQCYSVPAAIRESAIDNLISCRHYDLAAWQSIYYATICSAVGTAVSLISNHLSPIKPRVFDNKEKQFIDHPIDELLKAPGTTFLSTNDFLEAYVSNYIITGNNYMIANSVDKNSIPRSLQIYPPEVVNPNQTTGGIIQGYDVYFANSTVKYTAEYDANLNRYRYFAILQNGAVSELFHSKLFNPKSYRYGIYGKSPLTEIYLEIEQQIASNKHNLSVLKRGATLSGIFKDRSSLSPVELDRLRELIGTHFAGEDNAGRPLLLNTDVDFTPTDQTNRDMDFVSLKKETKEIIYNKLHIPLPYISADTMTMANLEASNVSIYDDAILPWCDRIFTELTTFLMNRYTNSETYELKYDESTIAALTTRRLSQLKLRQELGAYTINELRSMDGAMKGLSGGEAIYGQSSQVPIANDTEDEFYTKE